MIEKYLGLPWLAELYNCFDLVRDVYFRELGVEIPVAGVDASHSAAVAVAFKNSKLKTLFKKIEHPEHLSVVAMSDLNSSHDSHCGIYINFSGVGFVLHNKRGVGVILERVDRLHWVNLKITGFYTLHD